MGPTYPIAIPTPIQGTETLSMWGLIVIVVKSLVRGGNNASGMCSVMVEDKVWSAVNPLDAIYPQAVPRIDIGLIFYSLL